MRSAPHREPPWPAPRSPPRLQIRRRGQLREVLPGFKYAAEQIRQLDQLRQRLVEQTSFDRKTLQAEEKVDYLLKTAQFFINLLARRQSEGPRKRARRTSAKSDPAAEPVWVQPDLL